MNCCLLECFYQNHHDCVFLLARLDVALCAALRLNFASFIEMYGVQMGGCFSRFSCSCTSASPTYFFGLVGEVQNPHQPGIGYVSCAQYILRAVHLLEAVGTLKVGIERIGALKRKSH